VALEVEVKSKNNDLAELTANKGLNATQVEHLITRAAPAAAKAAVGGATPAISRAIEGTLMAREA
jgi:homoserine dehydrogenase